MELTTNLDVTHRYDQIIADVMPESWPGHARISVYQRDDLSEKQKQAAMKAATTLAGERGYSVEEAKTAAIEAAKKKLD